MKRRTILKEIGNEFLNLYQAPGYFYFEYDNGVDYETHSVYVDRVSHLFIEEWVSIGKEFIQNVEDMKND